jgi:pimeloyl-ACP methyl ester carboxylesterase
MRSSHSIRGRRLTLAAGLATWALVRGAVNAAGQAPVSSSFTIFMRSVPVGSEQVSVEQTADGWTITSSSRTGAPVNLVARLVQVRYTRDWKPLELAIDATLQGDPLQDRTTVTGTTAESALTQAGASVRLSDQIAADALLLPSPFWGPFEALATRLKTASEGSTIPAYLLRTSVQLQVGRSSDETIQTAARIVHARRTLVSMPTPGAGPTDVEVWGDENGHLLRLTIPDQNLDVLREDIASVAARRVVVSRAGDEQGRIAANGFTLAATISKPGNPGNKLWPAVVLVSGSSVTDRDEIVAGIPIFGQLANALADAGFLVVRYDRRGSGQSGGRTEAAALADYVEDLRAVVKFATDRKDVDRKRVAVVAYGEGGAVAMLAASREGRIGALVLAGAMGVSGAELNLYQVAHALERSNRPEAERQSTIELQRKIQNAVLTGTGWDAVPAAVRRQADTPWFQSFLAFDPAQVMSDVDQPVLIVQGELDTQVPPSNADRLEALAKGRKKPRGGDVVRIPSVNHLFVPATTGETDEYAGLKDKHVSPSVVEAIAGWLQQTFASVK